MTHPNHDILRELAHAYNWEVCGYASTPGPRDMILLSRWENVYDEPVPAPPVRCMPDGTTHYQTVMGEPHQAFMPLPYFADILTWRNELFANHVNRVILAPEIPNGPI
ncbi:MAG: hypothetical protein ACHQ9S_18705 [Candidatus Binatia bacterium]